MDSNVNGQESSHRSQDTKVIASVNYKQNDNVPMINFTIEGEIVSALVDSGSSISLISPDLFEKLKEKKTKFKYLGNNIRIQSFSGTLIPFKHCVQFTFKLQNAFTLGTFYVTENNFTGTYKILLGCDYLRNNHIILDMKEKQLKLKNIKIPLNHFENKLPAHEINIINSEEVENSCGTGRVHENYISVKSVNKIYISPGQEKIVSLICPEFLEKGTMVLFEPNINKVGIECYHSVHELSDSRIIHVVMGNNSEKKIILQKGKQLGTLSLDFECETDKIPENITDGNVHQINTLNIDEVHKLREAELTEGDFDLKHLSAELQEKMGKVLMQHAHAFSKSYKTLGQTSLVVPRIKLSHDFPIQAKPYRNSHTIRQYAQGELKKLLEANIIEKSTSSYAFPVLFVKKKSATKEKPKYRLACDYRMLNAILEGYTYAIPDIHELLQRMSGKKYYTVLDLHSAFFQINLRPEDKEKLAFITEHGKYQPVRLNFGLKVSPTTFAELIDNVLGHFNKEEVSYFIDDLIIASNSTERMITLLEEVLQTLIQNNLTVEPSKMQVCKTEIEFLGYKVNENGYSPSNKNIDKIEKLARPKNKKGVKSLLGLANYFRSLIHRYSEIVDPLVELTKEKVKFHWSEAAEKAFLAIQKAIIENPTLRPPDFNKPFFLITDGSKTAISAILAQKYGEEFVPIQFYGRRLKDSEKRYPSIKFELLAIHDACIHFEKFLLGRKFTILTDSKALTYHLNLEQQSDIVARWIMRLADFDYEIEYLEGEKNPADYVSRFINSISTQNELQNKLFTVNFNLSEEKIKEGQRQDTKLLTIIQKIENDKQNRITKKFELNENQVLILKQRDKGKQLRIAPTKLIYEIIQEAHKAHFGFPKTYDLIKSRFFWYGMYRDIKNYCASCIACNKNKQHKTIKVPLQEVVKDQVIGSYIHVDIVGKLPLTLKKHAFILTILDAGSRFLQAIPLRNVESQTIINTLTNYFSTFGYCKELVMDNARYFRSAVMKEYCKALGVNPHFCSTYKGSSNGLLESTHKHLKSSIQAMSENTTEWDIRLPFFVLSYNTSKNRSTGVRPDMLFFARETANHFTALDAPDEQCTQEFVKKRIAHIKEVRKLALRQEQHYRQEYVGKDFEKTTKLKIGDQVYLKAVKHPLALHPKFEGPFEVTNSFRNNNYLLKHMLEPKAKKIKRHITHMWKPSAKIILQKDEEGNTDEV